MKLRRLMQVARRGRSLPKGNVVRHSKIGREMQRWVGSITSLPSRVWSPATTRRVPA